MTTKRFMRRLVVVIAGAAAVGAFATTATSGVDKDHSQPVHMDGNFHTLLVPPTEDCPLPYLLVNGVAMREPYLPESYLDRDDLAATDVKTGYYFVLGDHRRSSNDSRSWGEVPERYIYGRAVFRFWPLRRIGPID